VYAIGVGEADQEEIEGIASEPASDNNAYMLSEFNDLANISSDIIKQTCRGMLYTFDSFFNIRARLIIHYFT